MHFVYSVHQLGTVAPIKLTGVSFRIINKTPFIVFMSLKVNVLDTLAAITTDVTVPPDKTLADVVADEEMECAYRAET